MEEHGDGLKPSVEGREDVIELNDIDLDVDTKYSPTDTYGALKQKLDKANQILDKLREKKNKK